MPAAILSPAESHSVGIQTQAFHFVRAKHGKSSIAQARIDPFASAAQRGCAGYAFVGKRIERRDDQLAAGNRLPRGHHSATGRNPAAATATAAAGTASTRGRALRLGRARLRQAD